MGLISDGEELSDTSNLQPLGERLGRKAKCDGLVLSDQTLYIYISSYYLHVILLSCYIHFYMNIC